MNEPRLEFLFARYFDGALTEEDRAELERVLLSSPQGRESFWEYARLHADISRWGQEAWGRKMASETRADEVDDEPLSSAVKAAPLRDITFSFRRWLPWLVAACVALAAGITFQRVHRSNATNDPIASTAPLSTAPAGIAVLASSIDARWVEGSHAFAAGAALEPGTLLKLAAGAAQIEFYSGARLIIQGPAEIELKSEMEAFCRAGRLAAHVPPPARGFMLSTDRMAIVDLGTEFGLNLLPGTSTEIYVFSGQVELHPQRAAGPVVTLTTGQAGEVIDGSIRRTAASPQSFMRESDYARMAGAEQRRQQSLWQQAVASLSDDPATLVHYTFPEDQYRERTIANLAASHGSGSAASIVGCSPADGRWSLTRAVEFRGPGDRMRLEVDGSLSAVTMLAWVRFDALPNSYHALISPDGLSEGTLRWGLTAQGELRLAIARKSANSDPNWEVVMSPPLVTPQQFGHWVLLASTFDGKSIRHYLNGQLRKTGDAYTPVPLRIGPAEVGNWRGPTPRFFRGRMDEMAILSRAMTEQQLAVIYAAGRPPDSP